MEVIKLLSDEYEKALKWLKTENLNIDTMNSIERIIFFNLWIISYFILIYRNNDYAKLQEYTHKIVDFKHFVKDIDYLIETYPNFIYNRLYRNFCNYNFNLEDYKFCLTILNTSKYDRKYLVNVNNVLNNKLFYESECNLKDMIVTPYLDNYFKNNKYID